MSSVHTLQTKTAVYDTQYRGLGERPVCLNIWNVEQWVCGGLSEGANLGSPTIMLTLSFLEENINFKDTSI